MKVPTADATPIAGDAAMVHAIVTAATTRSLGSFCSVIIRFASCRPVVGSQRFEYIEIDYDDQTEEL
jgi:hypothetical protein